MSTLDLTVHLEHSTRPQRRRTDRVRPTAWVPTRPPYGDDLSPETEGAVWTDHAFMD